MFGEALTDVALADGGALALSAWRAGWTPPPILTVSEYADTYRQLPAEAAKEHGTWRTSRTPFLRAIMDDLSVHSPVTEVNFKKSTQVGGTEVVINFMCYVIDHAPGPMMYVLPSIPVARNFSEQRITPMFDLMPTVRKKLGPKRSRDSGNTTLMKKFPAGFLVFSGANSASSLASMPIKYLILDELSKYPRDLDDQGQAQVQAERRTSSYTGRKKIARISSPAVKDACAISAEYDRGDQQQYQVPCPHCLGLQVLHIDQLTDDGQFLCIHCGRLINEQHKTWMLQEFGHSADGLARWVAQKPGRSVRSYHLWAAYSPQGLGYSWLEIAAMRKEAKDDPEKEVTFVNTILGEAYEGASQRVEANEVEQRAEKWLRRTIPRGCLLLTVGVDVQANRFSIGLYGWGRGETCYALDWVELPADPTNPDDWAALDEYLAQPLVNSCGVSMRISGVAVDSGNWTHDVYKYVRPRQSQGVIAIKGANTQGAPVISRPRKQDSTKRGQGDRKGIKRWMVGGDTIKTTLMQRLLRDAELPQDRRRFHFPADHEHEFYEQLTAERYDLVLKRWIKASTKRNEVLDTLQYAYAVACSPSIRMHVMRDADWAALEAKLEPSSGDLFAPAPPAAAVAEPAAAQRIGAVPSAVPTLRPPQAPATAIAAPAAANPFASNDWLQRR